MPIDHMFAGWVQMSDKSYACEFDHIVAFCAVSIWNLAFVYVWKKKKSISFCQRQNKYTHHSTRRDDRIAQNKEKLWS